MFLFSNPMIVLSHYAIGAPLLGLFERLDVSHPDGVLSGQPRHEEDGAARGHVDGAVVVWLEDAEGPVEVGLLLEVGAHVRRVALADALKGMLEGIYTCS